MSGDIGSDRQLLEFIVNGVEKIISACAEQGGKKETARTRQAISLLWGSSFRLGQYENMGSSHF